MKNLTEQQIARFWAKVNKQGGVPPHMPHLGECWLWTGWRYKNGYGGGVGEHKYAHRMSWEIHFGPIPPGLVVGHKCDEKLCCRIDHLFLGTQKDNIYDMLAKNREAHNVGERAGTAKLSNETAQRIREMYATGNYMQSELGEMFGLHDSSISAIVRGKQYVTAETKLYPMPVLLGRDAQGRFTRVEPAEKIAA